MLVIATIVHVRYRVIIQSVYLLYGNVRPKGCLKKEVVIMLKNLIFLFCFVLFCFACLFFCLFGGGGAHASQEKRREHKSLPTEYKRGITEN